VTIARTPQARIRRLRRDALPADTETLARHLLGRFVVRTLDGERLVGRIVETEAYLPGDAASHAFRGRTPRNGSMFLRRGHAYVYLAYGSAWMLNVSSESADVGAAVLIRALEPVSGLATMARLRGDPPARDLARGPGRLAQALAIDRALDGLDLCAAGAIWLGESDGAPVEPGVSVRIGITRDADRPLRYYVPGNRNVSGPARLNRGMPGIA